MGHNARIQWRYKIGTGQAHAPIHYSPALPDSGAWNTVLLKNTRAHALLQLTQQLQCKRPAQKHSAARQQCNRLRRWPCTSPPCPSNLTTYAANTRSGGSAAQKAQHRGNTRRRSPLPSMAGRSSRGPAHMVITVECRPSHELDTRHWGSRRARRRLLPPMQGQTKGGYK